MIGRKGMNKTLALQGFIDAAPKPNFLIPVFGDDGEEGLFMQAVNEDSSVIDFSRLPRNSSSQITFLADLSSDNAPEGRLAVGIGDSALFSFRVGDKEVWTGTRTLLSERLLTWLAKSAVNPLLRLEILEFCNASTELLRKSVTVAGRYLVARGVLQGARWADLQLTRLPKAPHREGRGARFLQSVEIEQPEPSLPSVYATTAYEFRDLIESGVISPKIDRVFGEAAVWTFYGRPAFRNTNALAALHMHPVAVIFRPNVADACVRIFPFDTGAFASGRYSSIHPDMTLNAFECPPDAAGKIVSVYFGGNEDYLLSSPRVDAHRSLRELGTLNFEAEAYALLLSRHDVPTIEMQFHVSIPINDDTTEAIIFPEPLLEDDVVKSFFGKHSIAALPYPTISSQSPALYQFAIVERLIAFYRERGYLSQKSNDASFDEFGFH
jgi:hypothetical protein